MTREKRDNCTVTLTVPIGPDRERAVRAARRWFELCPERQIRTLPGANKATLCS